MSEVPLERQLAAVRDEISKRRRVYPRWVADGRMSQDQADRRLEEMAAVRSTLERLLAEQKSKTTPQLF